MDDLDIKDTHLMSLIRDLDNKLIKKIISKAEYSKSMITIAYEYSMLGLSDNAILTFINITENYFKSDGIKDLENDPDLYQKCSFLLTIFDFLGIIPIKVAGNVPSANA